jgi:DNA-directed RNA polymerase specialized sigma24 family protein
MVQVADSGLLHALERLQVDAPLSADVVWLRYIAGLSVEQTALALDVSPRTVNNHWLHARAWLRRALASNPSDDMT